MHKQLWIQIISLTIAVRRWSPKTCKPVALQGTLHCEIVLKWRFTTSSFDPNVILHAFFVHVHDIFCLIKNMDDVPLMSLDLGFQEREYSANAQTIFHQAIHQKLFILKLIYKFCPTVTSSNGESYVSITFGLLTLLQFIV